MPTRTRAGNRIVFPITFEKGLFEEQEESVLAPGYLTVLENWVPEASGALRARRRWQSGSQSSGLPATRKTRGIGTVAVQESYATPSPRQTNQAQGADVTSLAKTWGQVTADQSLLLAAIQAKFRPKITKKAEGTGTTSAGATWPSATTTGNYLLAVVAAQGGPDSPTITAPAGWTLIPGASVVLDTGGGAQRLSIYHIENAASRSGTETFSHNQTSGTLGMAVQIFEVQGMLTTGVFDKEADDIVSSGTLKTSGTTATTTQPDELWIAAIYTSNYTQSNPTNGYSTEETTSAGNFQLGTYKKIAEVIGQAECTVTVSSGGGSRLGISVALKAATNLPTITPPAGWTLLNQGTLGNGRTALYAIFPASTRSGSESFSFSQNSRAELLLVEYTGVTARDTGIDAVSTGTSTAPSVTDATLTSPVTGQKVLVLALLGSGQVEHTAHSGGFSPVVGTDLVLHSKIETGAAAQTFGATLNTSAPWVAVLEAYESALASSSGGYFVAAHDDGTNFDIWAIPRDSLMDGSWSLIDANRPAADRTILVAFADGLTVIMYTHPDFTVTRSWNGATAADVTAAPRGRTICFYRNRFFIGGTKAGAFGNNNQTSNVARLWYSDLGSATVWNNNNFIDVNQDDGEPIEDIAPVSGGLLIAKRSSLWFLSGTGPDNFQLDELEAGDGYPGRCICVGEHGATIAGKHHLWVWDGGRPMHMSGPVEGTYEIGGTYVTSGCSGPLTWICDSGSGVIWVHDHTGNTWWIEKVMEQPACVFAHEEMILYGPLSSTAYSLLAFRHEPGSPRSHDVGLSTTYKAETPELYPGGAGQAITPRHLYLELRQRGGDHTDMGLMVTPIYDGVEQTVLTIPAQATPKPFTHRLDIGSLAGIKGVKFRFQQDNTMMDEAVMDIERVEFIGLVSPHR